MRPMVPCIHMLLVTVVLYSFKDLVFIVFQVSIQSITLFVEEIIVGKLQDRIAHKHFLTYKTFRLNFFAVEIYTEIDVKYEGTKHLK